MLNTVTAGPFSALHGMVQRGVEYDFRARIALRDPSILEPLLAVSTIRDRPESTIQPLGLIIVIFCRLESRPRPGR